MRRYLVAALSASTGCELRECVLGKEVIKGKVNSRDIQPLREIATFYSPKFREIDRAFRNISNKQIIVGIL